MNGEEEFNMSTSTPTNTAAMRPDSIAGIVGQEPLKRNLSRVLEVITAEFGGQYAREANPASDRNAWSRATGMASGSYNGGLYLLSGSPGMGKSTVAKAFASDLGRIAKANEWPEFSDQAAVYTDKVEEWTEQGPPTKYYRYAQIEGADLKTAADLDAYLHRVQPMGVLFIDEAHGMKYAVQDALLEVLESGTWRSGIRGGQSRHQAWILILAKNYEDKLRPALRGRAISNLVMLSYLPVEQAEMVRRVAVKCGFEMPEWMVEEVVNRNRGVPRGLVKSTLSLAAYFKLHPGYTREQVLNFMSDNAIYPAGVDVRGVGVLRILARCSGSMSTADLLEAAGITKEIYEAEVRPSLVNGGDMLISITRGVSITPRGRQILAEVGGQ